jgi:hypothetical protein
LWIAAVLLVMAWLAGSTSAVACLYDRRAAALCRPSAQRQPVLR